MTKTKRSKQNQNQKPQKTKTKIVYKDKPLSIGAQIGDGLQKFGTNLFTKWMGSGDYTCNDGAYDVKYNALIKGGAAKPTRMGQDGKGNFVFEHSEFITDITSSATINAFKQQSFTVNPANSALFPWLANIATNFETYEIEGMIFRYVSSSGDSVASTNTAIGTVMGTYAYDPLDAPFVSKNQMLQYDDTVSCRTSQNFICGVECDKSRLPTFSSKLYVGSPAAGSDPRMYNAGNFVVASQGVQAASVTLGELWVSYRIKFHITKDSNNIQEQRRLALTGTLAAPFVTVLKNVGSTEVVITNTSLTFPNMSPGVLYLVRWDFVNPGAINFGAPAPGVLVGAEVVPYFNLGSESYWYTNSASVSRFSYAVLIRATAEKVVLNSPVTSGPASIYGTDFSITAMDDDILG